MTVTSYSSQYAHDLYVIEKLKERALARLKERIDAGEDPYEILEIDKEHKYYVDKIVSGLCPISYALYGRIMEVDIEDIFEETSEQA